MEYLRRLRLEGHGHLLVAPYEHQIRRDLWCVMGPSPVGPGQQLPVTSSLAACHGVVPPALCQSALHVPGRSTQERPHLLWAVLGFWAGLYMFHVKHCRDGRTQQSVRGRSKQRSRPVCLAWHEWLRLGCSAHAQSVARAQMCAGASTRHEALVCLASGCF